jgi:hypothetical protein
MNKLKLDLDELQVDSFDTMSEPEARGTVHGLQTYDTCYNLTCYGADCPGYTNNCGYTPACPGYGCTNLSTCKRPTAVYDNCPATWTDSEPECWVNQPQTFYCHGDGGETGGGGMC